MARSRFLVLVGMALAGGLLAAPANAAPKGDCLWSKTSEPIRESYLDQYRKFGPEALAQTDFGQGLNEPFTACGVADTYEANFEAGAILGAVIMENGSEQVLWEEAEKPIGTLPGLWQGLPEADRESLRVMARGLLTKGSDESARAPGFAVIARVSDGIGVSGALEVHIAVYFVARATREVLEAGGMPKPADRS